MKKYKDNGFIFFYFGGALFMVAVALQNVALAITGGLILAGSSAYIFSDYILRLLKRLRR